MQLEMDDIRTLVELLDAHDLTEMSLKIGGDEIVLKKEKTVDIEKLKEFHRPPMPPMPPMSDVPANAPAAQKAAPTVQAETVAEAPAEASVKDEGQVVESPLAGVFYRSPKPDEAPYVSVGSHVKKGDTLGLIEAMKVMSEIPSPYDGVITEIALENAEFAEFGARLFTIKEQADV